MATVLRGLGDGVEGKRIAYVARKVQGPWLVSKSGRHRGLRGTLVDAEAFIERPVELNPD